MSNWLITAYCRKTGSIGIWSWHRTGQVEAADRKTALELGRAQAYENGFDHIHDVRAMCLCPTDPCPNR